MKYCDNYKDTNFHLTYAVRSEEWWYRVAWFTVTVTSGNQYTSLPHNITDLQVNYCMAVKWKLVPFYFLPEPPHPHKPFMKPVSPAAPFFPPAAASILSSSDGNSTKLNARSKNKGLHGIGLISGGSLYTLGVRDTNDESSLYSPNCSNSGCMKTTN